MNVGQNKFDNACRTKKMLSWLLTATVTPITSSTLRSSVLLKSLRRSENASTLIIKNIHLMDVILLIQYYDIKGKK